MGVKKAPVAIVRSVDRGYDGGQVAAGLATRELTKTGQIVSDRGRVSPSGEPGGVIKHNGAAGGSVSAKQVKKSVVREERSTWLEHALSGKASGDAKAQALIAAMVLAALNGYSPEQIILDGLLADSPDVGIRPSPDTKDCCVIVDANGDTLAPGGAEIADDAAFADTLLAPPAGSSSRKAQKPPKLKPGEDLHYSGTGLYRDVGVDGSVCTNEQAPMDVTVNETGKVTVEITTTNYTHNFDTHQCDAGADADRRLLVRRTTRIEMRRYPCVRRDALPPTTATCATTAPRSRADTRGRVPARTTWSSSWPAA